MEKYFIVGAIIVTKQGEYTIIDMNGYANNQRYGLLDKSNKLVAVYSELRYIVDNFQDGAFGDIIWVK